MLLVTAEIFMWSALGLIVLPLGLIPQTKGMLFSYLKKLISLTLYKPCMMLVAFLNYGIIFKRNYQSNALFKSNNGNAKRDYGR